MCQTVVQRQTLKITDSEVPKVAVTVSKVHKSLTIMLLNNPISYILATNSCLSGVQMYFSYKFQVNF